MQVYRGMDVGTAKPSAELRARVTHHLVDVADPGEQFNAGKFVNEAERLIREIRERGKVPVVCGGTAFYVTSLLFGLPDAPPVEEGIRDRLRAILQMGGQEALYRMLEERDPQAAARIQPGDRYRTMRALEVVETGGKSLFSYRWPRTPRTDMRFLLVGLVRPREELYARIDARVQVMFAGGLVREVKGLLEMGYGPSDPGMRGIGYRQLLEMRRGCETFRCVQDRIARDTRRYAKRQLTFFRSVPGVSWMEVQKREEIGALIDSFAAAALDHAPPNPHSAGLARERPDDYD